MTAVDVDIAAHTRVRFSSCDTDLPALLQTVGLSVAASESVEPVLHIIVARQLDPPQQFAQRVRDDALVEPSTLWLLDRSGAAVAGFPFASWDKQITATTLPNRILWLLRLLLPVALPGRGLLTGHGAAYVSSRGTAMVLFGLPNSGKTGATLAAVAHGGKFLADDLVVIDPAGLQIAPTNMPVSVAYSYLQQYPQFKSRVAKRTLAKLHRKTQLLSALGRVLPAALIHRLFPARLAKRWENLLTTRVVVELPRDILFDSSELSRSGKLDHLVALVAAETEATDAAAEGTSFECTSFAASQRWCLAVKQDTSEVQMLYDIYRYAFPETRCETLENHAVTVAKLLASVLETGLHECRLSSLVVDWRQPNPERLRAGLEVIERD